MYDTILLIEDERTHVRLFEINLHRIANQLTLTHAFHGKEGLEKLEAYVAENAGRLPLILLDLNMPVMDGFEFLEVIRHDVRFAPAEVVILTTSDAPNDIQRCNAMGCKEILIKPVDYGDLEQIIMQYA